MYVNLVVAIATVSMFKFGASGPADDGSVPGLCFQHCPPLKLLHSKEFLNLPGICLRIPSLSCHLQQLINILFQASAGMNSDIRGKSTFKSTL